MIENEPKRKNPINTNKETEAVSKEKIQQLEHILGATIIDGKIYYSEAEVWKKVAALNPTLFAIAQRDGMSLDEVIEFAEIVETKLDLNSGVFVQIAEHKLNTPAPEAPTLLKRIYHFCVGKNDQEEDLKKKWENVLAHGATSKEETNHDYKKTLLYDAVKAAYDHTEGNIKRSPIIDTHLELQRSHINEQDDTIHQQRMAMIVTVLLTIGGWGFGIIGQVINPCNNSTA